MLNTEANFTKITKFYSVSGTLDYNRRAGFVTIMVAELHTFTNNSLCKLPFDLGRYD